MTSIKDTFIAAAAEHMVEQRSPPELDPDHIRKYMRGVRYIFEAVGAGLEAVINTHLTTGAISTHIIDPSYASQLIETMTVADVEQSGMMPELRQRTWLPNPKHLHAVAVERTRQIAKGYDAAHDDAHRKGEIARGAAAYAVSAAPPGSPNQLSIIASIWPWPMGTFDPGSKQQDIVKAIAMLFAELERLERAAMFDEVGQ